MLLQTTTTESNADLLIKVVLESGLSPCIQQNKIQSSYIWGENFSSRNIVNEIEVLLSFKVFKKDFKKLEKLILKYHSYKLPEIVGVKLYKVSKAYKKWCEASL